jgi:hypothetical protein
VEATGQLSLIAELGIGFAGFLAIFLIFARHEGRFSPADSVRVRAIILASFTSIFLALLPLLLSLAELEEATLWRASSLVYLAVVIPSTAAVGRLQFALRPEDRAELGLFNNIISWGLASVGPAVLTANAIGIFGDPSPLPYLMALVATLGIATSNFITIAFQRLL